MNAKLLKLAGGSVLTAMLLAGCGGDAEEEPVEDPAVEEDVQDEEGDEDMMKQRIRTQKMTWTRQPMRIHRKKM